MSLMEKLWPRMGNLYGFKFGSQFGESPSGDWATTMLGVTGQQIAHGLQRCLNEYPEWPPGAAQFRALCLDLEPDGEGNDLAWQRKLIDRTERETNEFDYDDDGRVAGVRVVERDRVKTKIESEILKSKRKAAGESCLADLKAMLG